MSRITKRNYRSLIDQEMVLDEYRFHSSGEPIALVYSNDYEIGMSSLGFQTAYRFLIDNGFRVERFFNNFRDSHNRPVSVEAQTTLRNFRKIAFHFSFELDYINAVVMLKDSGIEFNREKRSEVGENYLIAGGIAVTANPLPLVDFFDAAFAGEIEGDVLSDIRGGEFKEVIDSSPDRGWFSSKNYLDSTSDYKITKRISEDWENYESFSPIITPNTTFRNMNLIEITRGCPIGCKFCITGNIHKGVRERPQQVILDSAAKHLHNSPYVGLIGAIPSLHSEIITILESFDEAQIKPSLSSLSVLSLTPRFLEILVKGGSKTLTLGIESFDETVQKKFGKRIPFESLKEKLVLASKLGMREIKLYLMLGLPGASDNEEVEIIDRIGEIRTILHKINPGIKITLSVNPFVPKIFTPYEKESFIGEKAFRDKMNSLKKTLSKLGVDVKSESHRGAFLQYLLSCGDEEMGVIIMGDTSGSGIKKSLDVVTGNLEDYMEKSSKKIRSIFK